MFSYSGKQTDTDEDLGQYLGAVARSKLAILGVSAAASLLAAIVVLQLTPIFQATAVVLIESQQAKVIQIEEIYGSDARSQNYYETQSEILGSRPLAEQVIASLALTEHPEFDDKARAAGNRSSWREWLPFGDASRSANGELSALERTVEKYSKSLSIEPVRNTQIVRIHFEAADPELAADVANAHVDAYIKSLVEARSDATDSAASWMLGRLVSLKDQLVESEQRLQEFREQEQLIDVEGLKALPASEINELTMRLVDVRAQLAQARIAYDQVYQGSDVPAGDLRSISAIRDDLIVQELQQVEAAAQGKVAEIARRYGPQHTAMIAAQSELTEASKNLQNQRRNVAAAIEKRYEAMQAEEIELVRALDRAKQNYQDIGRKESVLIGLEREGETNRDLYELFYNRIGEMSATGDLETVPARVVSPAVAPSNPIKPRKKLTIGLVFAFSLMAGVTVALFREITNDTIRSAADVDNKLGLPLLGMVPLVKRSRRSRKSGSAANFHKLDHGFGEAMRTIRSAISLDNLENPHKVIIVTSAIGDEGKSTVAVNLARAFAQSEKVLIIDADMRRPAIARQLEKSADGPGLSHVLEGSAVVAGCIRRDSKDDLDVMLSGETPADPQVLLSSGRLSDVVKVLRGTYDRIIIDTPPILPVSDVLVLSQHADAVIFLAKADSTSVRLMQQSLVMLAKVDAQITGVIVNQLDISKASKYSGYGYGGYFDAYESQSAPG